MGLSGCFWLVKWVTEIGLGGTLFTVYLLGKILNHVNTLLIQIFKKLKTVIFLFFKKIF